MSMPYHLEQPYNDSDAQVDIQLLHNTALTNWGAYWAVNQDRGTGLGYPKINTISPEWGKSTARGMLADLPLMPSDVELVDQVLCRLPYAARVAAWQWWVVSCEMSYRQCAKAVEAKTQTKVTQASLTNLLFLCVGAVIGTLTTDYQ